MTQQREFHKQIYYCAFSGNVSKEVIICHSLNVLKQMKTQCNLCSYWKDLQHRSVSLDVGNPLQWIQQPVMFEKLASSGQQIPAYLRLLVDFLSTQTQVRPVPPLQNNNVATRNEFFPTLYPPVPPFRQIILPRFQRNPREAYLLFYYLQDSSQHKSRKWFPGADCLHPSPPLTLKSDDCSKL